MLLSFLFQQNYGYESHIGLQENVCAEEGEKRYVELQGSHIHKAKLVLKSSMLVYYLYLRDKYII